MWVGRPGYTHAQPHHAIQASARQFTGNLPPHIKSVAVPTFVNKTQEPAVENAITSAVINAFVTSGKLRVVPMGEADSILEGEIIGYQIQSTGYQVSARTMRMAAIASWWSRALVTAGDAAHLARSGSYQSALGLVRQVVELLAAERGLASDPQAWEDFKGWAHRGYATHAGLSMASGATPSLNWGKYVLLAMGVVAAFFALRHISKVARTAVAPRR